VNGRLPPELADLREALAWARGSSRAADRSYARLEAFIAGANRGAKIEMAFGVESVPGELPWYDQPPAEQVRDSLVARLAAHFPGRPTVRAKAIAAAALHYAARYSRLLRSEDVETSEDPVKRALWDLHRNANGPEGRWPVEWRTVYRILSRGAVAVTTPAGQSSGTRRRTA